MLRERRMIRKSIKIAVSDNKHHRFFYNMTLYFNSLDDIKINTNDYIELYKKNFNCLINQTNKDRSYKIDQIMAELRDKKIFEINGNDDFKEKIYSNIRELLEVKPGRLLIRELTKLATLFDEHISVKSGEKFFRHSDGIIEVNLNKCLDDNYNALSESKEVRCSKPKAITLAHELVHELHKREEELQALAKYHRRRYQAKEGYAIPNFVKDIEIYPDPIFQTATFEGLEQEIIFKNLSCLEEEHTILGVNVPRFLKKKKMNKLDVLCENAFLCAFNLLPRIDHQNDGSDSIEETIQVDQNNLSAYYHWLSVQLNERNKRIEKMKENHQIESVHSSTAVID
jgi:hypothetical protein